MAVRYAPFSSSEFGCFGDGLDAASVAISLYQAEMELDKIDKELESYLRSKPSRGQLRERIEETIARISETRSMPDADRVMFVTRTLDEIRSDVMKEWKFGGAVAGIVPGKISRIYELYTVFDVERFNEDFNEISEKENGSTVEDQIKNLNKDRGKILAHIKKSWSGKRLLTFFKHIPETWREKRQSESFSKGDMALHIMKSFVETWIERSRLFAVPVTVGGVLIRSLRPKMKSIWTKLYEQLNLNPGEAEIYRYHIAEREVEGLVEATPDSPPGMFGDSGSSDVASSEIDFSSL